MSWRLKWTLHQLCDFRMLQRNRELLSNPQAYYVSLLLKTVPGMYRRPIRFRLRQGPYTIPVESLMTAYVYKEIFADSDYDLLLDTASPAILDIGANTGLFALRMKQLYPDAQIACFEPEKSNFVQLQTLVSENRLTGVQVHQKGIGARTMTSTLYLHPRNMGGHSLIRQEADWIPSKIELLSLEDALRGLSNSTCDLMKLDCEGAEYEIVRSMDAALAKRIRCIVFEVSGHLYNPDDLYGHLGSLGYRLEHSHGLTIARLEAAGTA